MNVEKSLVRITCIYSNHFDNSILQKFTFRCNLHSSRWSSHRRTQRSCRQTGRWRHRSLSSMTRFQSERILRYHLDILLAHHCLPVNRTFDSILPGCQDDTTLINMHEAPKVSATKSWPYSEDGRPKWRPYHQGHCFLYNPVSPKELAVS